MPLYFAYGSCMSEKDLARTVKAKKIGTATLYDYKLGFTRYSIGREGGVADIVPSPSDYVEGVLFEVPNFKGLDKREGHPTIYRRKRVKVLMNEFQVFTYAYTYEVLEKSIIDPKEYAPSEYYKGLIFEGAKALSQEYQSLLKDVYINFE
jgi:hypothetical protein